MVYRLALVWYYTVIYHAFISNILYLNIMINFNDKINFNIKMNYH